MATTNVYTFQDACEHLWGVFNPSDKPPTGRELRSAKMAVINSMRKIANVSRWTYYQRRLLVATEASYSTGTVTYDHTAGTYERQLTLASGTWPSNAAFGTLKFNDAYYPIESRKSDTVVTLDANYNPGADVASTTYAWYRDTYPLPVNLRAIKNVVDEFGPLEFVSPDEFLIRNRDLGGQTSSRPEWFTILNDGKYLGALSIAFGPPPSTAVSYEAMYAASPLPLRTYKYSTGTASVAANGTAVVGGGTTWTDFHVGSIIRFTSSTTNEPTNIWGTVAGVDNPYLAQRMITAVADTTHLTIDAIISATSTLSLTKYVISDPIDVEEGAMMDYFLREIEAEYCKITKRDDWKERDSFSKEAMFQAMANDIRYQGVQNGSYQGEGYVGVTWGDVDSGGPE